MRKKLKGEAGLTLVELMAVTAILVLLGLMLATGMQMAMRTYRTIVAQSEVELLLSTAVDALTDDLRYAQEVDRTNGSEISYTKGKPDAAVSGFTYSSDSYGEKTKLDVKNGQIVAQGPTRDWRVLSTGAYGAEGTGGSRTYEVTELKITANADNTFTINLTVAATADNSIRASTPEDGVTVRCLNPMKDAEGDP